MEISMTKYFNAVADNKRIDAGLKVYEHQIDAVRRKAINRIWKTKYDLLDELVLLNVKTPQCSGNDSVQEETRVDLKRMNLDDKLFSTKPVSFGHKKSKTPMEPVIEVRGKEAICFPNSEAKRGRHVSLDRRTVRRIESARLHTAALHNIDLERINRQHDIDLHNSRRFQRPFTAPRARKSGLSSTHDKRLLNRPRTSIGFTSFRR